MILGLSAEAGWWKGTLTKAEWATPKNSPAYLNDDARFQVVIWTFLELCLFLWVADSSFVPAVDLHGVGCTQKMSFE